MKDFFTLDHTLIGAMFAMINILIRPLKGSVWMYMLEFFLSVTVATLIGVASVKSGVPEGMSLILVACSALLARDILNFVVGLGDFVNENKDAFYKHLFRWLNRKLGNK